MVCCCSGGRFTRTSTAPLFLSVLTLLGFVTNRMNVAITGMEASSGTYYFPKWTEIAITLSLVAAAFALFCAGGEISAGVSRYARSSCPTARAGYSSVDARDGCT